MSIDGQLDILAVLEEQETRERSAETAARLGITGFTNSVQFTPDELEEAFDAWRHTNGSFGSYNRSHMWKLGYCSGGSGAHASIEMTADLSSGWPDRLQPPRLGPGGLVYRTYCHDCRWWTPIVESSREASIAYLDHCWPGWRGLPPVPQKGEYKRPQPASALPDGYPEEWKLPGAPTINYDPARFTAPKAARPSFTAGYSVFGGMGIGIHPSLDYPELTAVPSPTEGKAARR